MRYFTCFSHCVICRIPRCQMVPLESQQRVVNFRRSLTLLNYSIQNPLLGQRHVYPTITVHLTLVQVGVKLVLNAAVGCQHPNISIRNIRWPDVVLPTTTVGLTVLRFPLLSHVDPTRIILPYTTLVPTQCFQLRPRTHTRTHALKHTYTHAHAHARTQTHTHTNTHTHTHKHTHTHTNTHTQTHTQTPRS